MKTTFRSILLMIMMMNSVFGGQINWTTKKYIYCTGRCLTYTYYREECEAIDKCKSTPGCGAITRMQWGTTSYYWLRRSSDQSRIFSFAPYYASTMIESDSYSPNCQATDCTGKWTLGACSVTCGEGSQTKTYSIITNAQNGGKECEYEQGQQKTQTCNAAQQCPESITLQIVVTGANEKNKEQTCTSIAQAIGAMGSDATKTSCKLKGTESDAILYTDIDVDNANAAREHASSSTFVTSLSSLPTDVTVTSVSIPEYYQNELEETCRRDSDVILSRKECEQALDMVTNSTLNIEWGDSHTISLPNGCSRKYNGRGKFNKITAFVGVGRADLYPICKNSKEKKNLIDDGMKNFESFKTVKNEHKLNCIPDHRCSPYVDLIQCAKQCEGRSTCKFFNYQYTGFGKCCQDYGECRTAPRTFTSAEGWDVYEKKDWNFGYYKGQLQTECGHVSENIMTKNECLEAVKYLGLWNTSKLDKDQFREHRNFGHPKGCSMMPPHPSRRHSHYFNTDMMGHASYTQEPICRISRRIVVNGDVSPNGFSWEYQILNPADDGKIYWVITPENIKELTAQEVIDGASDQRGKCNGSQAQMTNTNGDISHTVNIDCDLGNGGRWKLWLALDNDGTWRKRQVLLTGFDQDVIVLHDNANFEFYKGKLGMTCRDDDEVIKNENDCQGVLNTIWDSSSFEWKGTYSLVPNGCSAKSNGKGYFNEIVPIGTGSLNLYPICKNSVPKLNSDVEDCSKKDWCEANILDEATAFMICMQFMNTDNSTSDISGNKCAYHCHRYGYRTNPVCDCKECVKSYTELLTNAGAKMMSQSYFKTCWERHFVMITKHTNDFCHVHHKHDINITTHGGKTEDELVLACQQDCLEETECLHVIVDHNKSACRLHAACKTRKNETEFLTAKWDHYFLMCPNRGGCDWRYRTLALYGDEPKPQMVMNIVHAPWAPFFDLIDKHDTVWAEFTNQKACSPTNTANFTGKIVLIRGTSPQEQGITPDTWINQLNDKPWPDTCNFADMILVAQINGAIAAYIVNKQKLTITVFDEMKFPHVQYATEFPKIPAGMIIYDYWEGFSQNEDGKIAIGCSAQFGEKYCIPVNYPNMIPGYIVCGCVKPSTIKRHNDISQVITLEPCWQMDPKDPRYCVEDSKNCQDFRHHLNANKPEQCGLWCGDNDDRAYCDSKGSECSGCPMCAKQTLAGPENLEMMMNALSNKTNAPLTTSFECSGSKGPKICNNILEKHTSDVAGIYTELHDDCYQKCKQHNESRCHFYSFHDTKRLCYLHVTCDLTMMPSEPGNYTTMRMKREFNGIANAGSTATVTLSFCNSSQNTFDDVLLDLSGGSGDCGKKDWCEKNILDEATAFMICMQFLEPENTFLGHYVPDLNTTWDPSENKCAYHCHKYGYKTNPSCGCSNCVSDYSELLAKKDMMSQIYFKTCWERHFVRITYHTNDYCFNDPEQNIRETNYTGNVTTEDELVGACQQECLDAAECLHVIIDHNNNICRLHKSCRNRKNTKHFLTDKLDHYFLMCPNRGGCDWRYQTAALYGNDSEPKMVMNIARAPWAPFYHLEKNDTVWAQFTDEHACTPSNHDGFAGKIVLIHGTSPIEAGPAPDNWTNPLGKKPWMDICNFADMILVAQEAGAIAAYIVNQKKFTITVFDEIGEGNRIYSKMIPNIPAGMIVYEYWDGFSQYQNGNIAIGCSAQFGQDYCIPVNYPNMIPGYIVCGCVMPSEITRYNDISQVISLEPCWQMDSENPRYCEKDSQNCQGFKNHLKRNDMENCSIHCRNTEGCSDTSCSGCPMCASETLADTENQNKLMNNLWYRMQTPQTSFEVFIKKSPKICNNILEKFTTFDTSEHDYETLHGACYKKCKKYKESRCHYYSFHNTKPLCNLHVNCDLTIMASEPGNYTIMRMNREYNKEYIYSIKVMSNNDLTFQDEYNRTALINEMEKVYNGTCSNSAFKPSRIMMIQIKTNSTYHYAFVNQTEINLALHNGTQDLSMIKGTLHCMKYDVDHIHYSVELDCNYLYTWCFGNQCDCVELPVQPDEVPINICEKRSERKFHHAPTDMTFNDGQAYCEGKDQFLVVPKNQRDAERVKLVLGDGRKSCWLGIHGHKIDKTWVADDINLKLNYKPWADKVEYEPNYDVPIAVVEWNANYWFTRYGPQREYGGWHPMSNTPWRSLEVVCVRSGTMPENLYDNEHNPCDDDCVNNVCDPNPCENGGECFISEGKALCQCASGYSGPTCNSTYYKMLYADKKVTVSTQCYKKNLDYCRQQCDGLGDNCRFINYLHPIPSRCCVKKKPCNANSQQYRAEHHFFQKLPTSYKYEFTNMGPGQCLSSGKKMHGMSYTENSIETCKSDCKKFVGCVGLSYKGNTKTCEIYAESKSVVTDPEGWDCLDKANCNIIVGSDNTYCDNNCGVGGMNENHHFHCWSLTDHYRMIRQNGIDRSCSNDCFNADFDTCSKRCDDMGEDCPYLHFKLHQQEECCVQTTSQYSDIRKVMGWIVYEKQSSLNTDYELLEEGRLTGAKADFNHGAGLKNKDLKDHFAWDDRLKGWGSFNDFRKETCLESCSKIEECAAFSYKNHACLLFESTYVPYDRDNDVGGAYTYQSYKKVLRERSLETNENLREDDISADDETMKQKFLNAKERNLMNDKIEKDSWDLPNEY